MMFRPHMKDLSLNTPAEASATVLAGLDDNPLAYPLGDCTISAAGETAARGHGPLWWTDGAGQAVPGHLRLRNPTGVGPGLYFQRVPEGKVGKNRVHLDVRVGAGLVGEERLAALEAECARLVALGAVRVRLLPADADNESCLVMQDIEGNEFDLD